MHVMLKQVLDCEPDAAWRAIRSPEVFRAVSSPLLTFASAEPLGQTWSQGEHPVTARLLGLIPVGAQVIDLTFTQRGDVRFVHDTGAPTSGALSVVSYWHHTMAVSPTNDGPTLFRDRLLFDAEPVSLLVWPAMWAFWQWRAAQLRRLAPGWV
ncbi:MAG: hypothetical protein KKH51_07865 [Actinobacteria bacterium]|nr:hypothetical protein [Actinomycetota bacterium]